MWKISLFDGTTIDNLKLNGNNFIATEALTEETFAGKLNGVKIECTNDDGDMFGLAGIHEHMRLDALRMIDGQCWFVLNDIPADEIKQTRLEANIEYLAMMTGVDL